METYTCILYIERGEGGIFKKENIMKDQQMKKERKKEGKKERKKKKHNIRI